MNTAYSAVGLVQATNSTQSISALPKRCLVALQQWRKLGRSQTELASMNDWTLTDIGITRGEIDG